MSDILSMRQGKKRHGTSIRKSRSDRIFLLFNGVFLGFILFIVVYPVWYAFAASFSEPLAVSRGELVLLPVGFDLSAYQKVFSFQRVMTGYANTLLYTSVGTVVNTVMVILTAYPLSRRDLWGKKLLTRLFVFTMYFSGGMIPSYLLIRELGLYNTMWALILPGCISMHNVIITRSFFEHSLPQEIQEAGMIDGCNNFRLLLKIVLPEMLYTGLMAILLYPLNRRIEKLILRWETKKTQNYV